MVLDQMSHCVETAVDGATMIIFIAEIPADRLFLIMSDMNGVPDEFLDSFSAGSGNRNDRDPEKSLELVDIDIPVIGADFIHHVERDDHGNVHLKKLYGQIQISLNIGCVQDIDDGPGLFGQNKIAGDQFLTAVGRHGIDSRKIGHLGVGVAADRPVFAADSHTRKVADMLIGACELVEKRRFSAVLVPHQGKCQESVLGEGITVSGTVESSRLAQTRVF